MVNLLLRQQFAELLSPEAEYLRIHRQSKAPRGSFAKGRSNRLADIPLSGNFGVLPRGRLIVLDVDARHEGSSVEAQEAVFSQLLGVKLSETFSVSTPNGGRHYYLLLPKGTSADLLPKATLRHATAVIRELTGSTAVIDADLRSGAANGYVVGPDSSIEAGSYSVAHFGPLSELSPLGVKNLLALSTESLKAATPAASATAEAAPKKIDLWAEDPLPSSELEVPSSDLPSPRVMRKLEAALRKRSFRRYHQARAFVKAALHCCHSNDAIAKVCSELGVDKDTHSNSRIHRLALQQDVHRFKPTGRFHGPYCSAQDAKLQEERAKHAPAPWTEATFQAHLRKQRARREARRALPVRKPERGNSRVLDVEAIAAALGALSNRKTPTAQHRHALLLVEVFLQPLSNAGAETVLLARSALTAHTGLSDSQVAQALRLLRQAKVVTVLSRQKAGVAPSYYVSEKFTHEKLTKYLHNSWGARVLTSVKTGEGHHPTLVYSPRQGGFFEALSGEAVHSNPLVEKFSEGFRAHLQAELPPEVSPTAPLASYLRYEAAWRAEHLQAAPAPSRATAPSPAPATEGCAVAAAASSAGENTSPESGTPAQELVGYGQLTVTEGWTPQKSEHRPGLRLPPPGRGERATFQRLVPVGTLGLGRGLMQWLPRITPHPNQSSPRLQS